MGQSSTKKAAESAKKSVETRRKEKSSVKSSSIDDVRQFSSIPPSGQHGTTSRYQNDSLRERGYVVNNTFLECKYDNRFERDDAETSSLDSTRPGVSISQERSARLGVLHSKEKAASFVVSQLQEIPAMIGGSVSQEKTTTIGGSVSQVKPATIGVSVSQVKPATIGVSVSQEKPATIGVSVSQEKPATIGVSVSQEKPATIGVSVSQEKTAKIGVSVSQVKPATIGVSVSQEKTTTIGGSVSQEKPATIGVSVSQVKTATIGVSVSQEKPATIGVSLSEEEKPAGFGVLQSQEKSARLKSSSQEKLGRCDALLSPNKAGSHGVPLSPEKAASCGVLLSPDKYASRSVLLLSERPGHRGVMLLQEKAASCGVFLSQEKPGNCGVTLSQEKTGSHNVPLSPEKTASLGVPLSPEKAASCVSLSPEKAGSHGVLLLEEKAKNIGVLSSKEKSGSHGVLLSQDKAGSRGVLISQDKAGSRGVLLSQDKAGSRGVLLSQDKAGSRGVLLSQDKAGSRGVLLSQDKVGSHVLLPSEESAGSRGVLHLQEKAGSHVLLPSEESAGSRGVSLSQENPARLDSSLSQGKSASSGVPMSQEEKFSRFVVSQSQEQSVRLGAPPLPQEQSVRLGAPLPQEQSVWLGAPPLPQEQSVRLGAPPLPQQQSTMLSMSQSQENPVKHGMSSPQEKPKSFGMSLSQDGKPESQYLSKPARLDVSQSLETSPRLGVSLSQEKPAKLGLLPLEEKPARLCVSQSQEKHVKHGVLNSQEEKRIKHGVMSPEETHDSLVVSQLPPKTPRLGQAVSQGHLTKLLQSQEKPANCDFSLSKEKPAKLNVSQSQAKSASFGVSESLEKPGKSGVPESLEKPTKRGVSKSQEKPVRRGVSDSQEKPVKHAVSESQDKPVKRGVPKSQEKPVRSGVSNSQEKPVRRGVSDSQEKPVKHAVSESQDKPVKRGVPKSQEKPVRSGVSNSQEKPVRRGVSDSQERPVKRGMSDSLGKPVLTSAVPNGVTSRTDGAMKEVKENKVKQQDKYRTFECLKLNDRECRDEVLEKTCLKKKPSSDLAVETKAKEAMKQNFSKLNEVKKKDVGTPKSKDETKHDQLPPGWILPCPGNSKVTGTCVTTETQKSASVEVKGNMKMGDMLDKECFGDDKAGKNENVSLVTSENTQVACNQSHSVEEDKDMVKYILTVLKQLEDENELLIHFIGVVVDVKFRVASFEKDSKNNSTVVEIHFKSNADARRFQDCLARSRKTLCFRYKLQKLGNGAPSKTRRESIKISQYISKKTEDVLGKHLEKIKETDSKFSNLNKAHATSNKKKKYIDISLHEQRESQKKALEYKKIEMKQQQDEFQSYLSNTIQRIESFKAENVEQKEYDCLLKRFDLECSRFEQALPIYAKRTQIVETILHNQVSIILGETGSGKSTQITQYILESELSSLGKIICTQPRKVAAVSLAQRVSLEKGSNVGDLVGYQTGMNSKLSCHTKVLYMTDHMLLNECLKDPLLSEFSCVVIDEAHERSVYTDLLLGMIKKCLPQRPTLHVVVTSATIDPDVFVRYFGGPEICPVLKVSGRMFPVEIEWQITSSGVEVVDDYEMKCIEKAAEVHRKEPPGDILVFLTSQAEIEKCAAKLEVLLRGGRGHWILPLHGKLQTEEQNLVFKVSPKGRRKIVLATNVAETSVTIPGIKYVIDSGAVKELLYDSRKKVSALRVVKVTKSSADQRKGRAGRTGPGKCYRLYSKEDYEKMCPTSIPEILKIHLGHAILKLLQLDVNPLEFDFVQAPEKVSMENAFQHLSKLGAIDGGKISPLGKWIAKLPFEPNLGVLVHDAIDHNVGLEGIIMAVSCTVSSSLFYRGGTEKEKEKSDKLKVPFCHKYGDHFTNLCVYKEWHKVDENQKGRWSRDNSINGKSMRSIRDATKEILYVLKRDLSINIRFEFSDADDVERNLQKLLFKAFQTNLCYFLGHEKAGYFFIDKNQQVIMHPSSAFQSLASCPNWVIVERVMQTSRDFGVNITAVADEDVEEALNEGCLDFDFDDVKRRKVTPVLTEYVGCQVHREFVGPRYSKVKAMQENLKMMCKDSVFVIDADRDKGEISMYAPIDDKEISSHTLKTAIDPIREKVKTETVEHPILPQFTNVRISVGPGGQVQDVLYQDEYKNVFIYGDPNTFHSIEEMVQWFERFGSIHSFIPKSPKNSKLRYLGQIIFDSSKFAKAAVIATKNRNSEITAKPPKGMGKSEEGDLLKARLTWCRRMPLGYGFVEIYDQAKMDEILLSSLLNFITVGGKRVRIKRGLGNKDKRPNEEINELHVSGFGELVNEDVLRESISNNFNISGNDIGRVTVVREKVNTTPEILHSLQVQLESEFRKYVHPKNFKVCLMEPGPYDFTYRAFVTFKDPEEGFEACCKLRNKMTIGRHVVSLIPEIHTRLFVLAPVYKRVEKNIQKYCEKIQNEDGGRRLLVKQLNDKYVIDIDADSIQSMVHTRNKVQKMLQGETVDLEKIPTLRYLFTHDGQAKVEKIMKKTKTLILLDHRNTSIAVHGENEDREIALRKVRKFVEELSSSRLRVFDLKGESKPPGLMKAVIVAHGVDLRGLKVSSNLSTVELDHRYHKIKMIGSDDAVEKAVKSIEEIMDYMRRNIGIAASNQPECGICLCEIDESDIYRLESCGHPYCRDCVKMNIESAIRNKEFPIRCSHDGCDMLWAWKDFGNMIKSGFCNLQTILNSSLSSFVMGNKDKVRYCITPDCPMVYKVSEAGGRIVCDVCRTTMCSKCHVEYHSGISCVMYQIENSNDETGLQKWMRQDPNNRKLCPNCFTGIEKNGGCQHMECRDCKSHICWICMKFFSTRRECYGHMKRGHGTFV